LLLRSLGIQATRGAGRLSDELLDLVLRGMTLCWGDETAMCRRTTTFSGAHPDPSKGVMD
jgi:hypothetical protein